MVKYGDALNRGLRFGVRPRRWLQFFILDMIFISAGLAIIIPNLSNMLPMLLGYSGAAGSLYYAAGAGIGLIAVFVVWVLARFWFMGSMVHQSVKEKGKISDSFRVAGRKYPTILISFIVVAVVSFIVGMVPYIGWILVLIVSWAFFFVLQAVVVSNLGIEKALSGSWKIFRKLPLQVFLSWLMIAIVTLVIYFIFSIPMIALFSSVSGPLFTMYMGAPDIYTSGEILSSLTQIIQANMAAFVAIGVIMAIGLAIATTFSIRAQTDFYQQLKKK